MSKWGRCGNCMYNAYCGCYELVVGIAYIDKIPDLDTFDWRQIIGARRMDRSFPDIVRELRFSRSRVSRVYQEYMDGGRKKLAIGQTAKDN